MGISGVSPMSLLLILLIVLVLFGPKRIGQIGKELGLALRQFRKGMDGEKEEKE